MARSSGSQQAGETKTPLVVALVFFILATLTLGVMTYLGYTEAGKERETATKANAEKTTMQNERYLANDRVNFYRVATGTADGTQRGQFEQSRFKSEMIAEQTAFMNALTARHGTAINNVKNEIGLRSEFVLNPADYFKWPVPDSGGNLAAPPLALIDSTIKALGERQLAQNKANTMEKNYNELKDLAQKTIDNYNSVAKAFSDATAQYPGKIADEAAKYEAKSKQISEQFTKDMDGARKEIQTKENEKFETAEKLNKMTDRANNSIKRAENAEAQLDAGRDPFSYDRPAGKIVRRVINSKQVEIDLGSADFLKPGIKFSVQPSDTKDIGLGNRLKEVTGVGGKKEYRIQTKANIEVMEIIGPNLSVCRITEEFDEVRDRVMAGDLLYNAVWRKGAADHIALIGVFDLDADGIDDLQFVINNLSKAGVIVDAYYDLGAGKWVGKITERTIFAVEGYQPVLKGLDGNADAKSRIISQIEQAKKDCVERGAKVVKIRDFFPRIGYDVNLGITDDRINQASAKYYSGPAKEGGDAAPMAEKKEN